MFHVFNHFFKLKCTYQPLPSISSIYYFTARKNSMSVCLSVCRLQQRWAPNNLGLHAIGFWSGLLPRTVWWLSMHQSPHSKGFHTQTFSWMAHHSSPFQSPIARSKWWRQWGLEASSYAWHIGGGCLIQLPYSRAEAERVSQQQLPHLSSPNLLCSPHMGKGLEKAP